MPFLEEDEFFADDVDVYDSEVWAALLKGIAKCLQKYNQHKAADQVFAARETLLSHESTSKRPELPSWKKLWS